MPEIYEITTTGSPSTLTTYVDGTAVIQATASGVTVLGQTVVSGPVNKTGVTVTGPTTYNVSTTETRLDCTSTGGAISIVLPAANGAGQPNRSLPIVDVAGSAGTNNITVTVTGGGTINGASSYVLNTNYGVVTVLSNGTAWVILDKNDLPTAKGTSGYVLTSQGVNSPLIWAASGGGGGGGYSGGVRQIVSSVATGLLTSNTAIPYDNTIPQNTEGAQFASVSITPQSATSSLWVFCYGVYSAATISTVIQALFRDSTANALAANATAILTANTTMSSTLQTIVASGSTSATTFKLRVGNNGGTTVYGNGASGGALLGGVSQTGITVVEYGA
jgi:hypothetical protein